MRRRHALTVLIALALASGGAFAACPPKPNTHLTKPPTEKCLDLGVVPAISRNIVSAEPVPAAKAPAYSLPTTGPYEGPILGMTKPDPGVRLPTPTVGYKWALQ